MTTITGPIKKLSGQLNHPIEYSLPIGDQNIPLNKLMGQHISFKFSNEIYCIQCTRKTSKSFQQGYCYPCYRKLMECNLCVIHPEKCNYPKAECPDTWEHEHCKQEHIVYLANSSGLKVDITRSTQVPTRWIDQGASQAIPLFKVDNRYQSGLVEVLFKQFVADKTNWRKMLNEKIDLLDMLEVKNNLLKRAEEELQTLCTSQLEIEYLMEPCVTLTYPILEIPKKVTALTFEKDPEISGRLLGIKGQYLILDKGVLNIRKHSGYNLSFSVI